MPCPARGVHQHDEQEKRQSEQTRRETRLNPRHQAQRRRNKATAYKVRPEQMPRNPRRYERRDDLRQCEMLGAEARQWCRGEQRPEQNYFVESSRLLPIAAKKNRHQPDRQNHSKREIRQSNMAGNDEDSKDYRLIRQAAVHHDSFPPVTSASRQSANR